MARKESNVESEVTEAKNRDLRRAPDGTETGVDCARCGDRHAYSNVELWVHDGRERDYLCEGCADEYREWVTGSTGTGGE